ncbi:hypothetical protein FsymDg_2355 [Candidatus Protofrankia datiscae]|uniref:Uncharacterized protein n=1 Tax=Candidatus Protofrankia datiscae TaxID=2716812 RepID=F8B0J1_9ACTN|nr:hypothetical protein FsymDg_2355 [Candidatus Protofrankia datiscae]
MELTDQARAACGGPARTLHRSGRTVGTPPSPPLSMPAVSVPAVSNAPLHEGLNP